MTSEREKANTLTPESTRKFRVFIAYDDVTGYDFAEHLKQALERKAVPSFVAKKDIPAYVKKQEKWREIVDGVIGTCNTFVVILSTDSLSPEVTREVKIAFERSKNDSKFSMAICHFRDAPRTDQQLLIAGIDAKEYQQVDFSTGFDLAREMTSRLDEQGFPRMPSSRNALRSEQPRYPLRDFPSPFITASGKVDAMIVFGRSRYAEEVKTGKEKPQTTWPAALACELASRLEFESILRRQDDELTEDFYESNHPSGAVAENVELAGRLLDKGVNIIAVGSGDTNPLVRIVLRDLGERSVVHFTHPDTSEKIIGPRGEEYAGEKDGLLLLLPNPRDQGKVILIAAGISAYGTQAALLLLARFPHRLRDLDERENGVVVRAASVDDYGVVEAVEVVRRGHMK